MFIVTHQNVGAFLPFELRSAIRMHMSLSHDTAGVLKDGVMLSAEVRSMWMIHRPSVVVTAGQFPSVVRLKNKLLMGFDPFLLLLFFFLQ